MVILNVRRSTPPLLYLFIEIPLRHVFHQEEKPEHAEEAHSMNGVLDAQRSERQGHERKEDADADGVVAPGHSEKHLPAIGTIG